MKPKFSIIIPTYKHLNKLILCCESIIKYTDMSNVEVLIVANGCGNDGTEKYIKSLGSPFRLIWINKKSGYAIPTNIGMKEATGDYVILLNNDTVILEQQKNEWIEMLLKPFLQDKQIGMSAPMKAFSESLNADFLIFFCVMISREVINTIGYLDEVFISYCEDIDYCMRAVNMGFKLRQVPNESNEYYEDKRMKGLFPIFHEGNVSHGDWEGGEKLIKKNNEIIRERYNKKQIGDSLVITKQKDNKKNILCSISTKGRYDTTLPLAIMSVINQTLLPNALYIYDDNENPKDLSNIEHYQYLFATLYEKGVECFIYYGDKKGQHYNHQRANNSGFDFVWRIDDDTVAEPNVLEMLYKYMTIDVGAVGGSILTPPFNKEISATGKIENIRIEPNLQWGIIKEVKEVDHLHCSYLYRAGVEDFCLELSNKAHREETMHSYGIKHKGYKVLIIPCITWHYKHNIGGIRSGNNDKRFYDHDERIFKSFLNRCKVGLDKNVKYCCIDGGIGDHMAFKNIIPELKKKYKKIIIAVCYPEVFFDDDIELISIQDARNILGNIDEYNIYIQMDKWNWKTSIVDAFRKLYEVEKE